jgi:hypothetical protein
MRQFLLGIGMRWLVVWSGVALVGCSGLRETTAYYMPVSNRYYAPKDKNEVIPVLSESPTWPHRVIGRFAMQSDRGYPFLHKALLYNARLQGADAVVVKKLGSEVRQNFNYIPPGWESVPQSNVVYQQVKNAQGQWVTVPQVFTTYVPVFRPGRTVVDETQWTDVAAEMVVRRDKTPLAAPGPSQVEMPSN